MVQRRKYGTSTSCSVRTTRISAGDSTPQQAGSKQRSLLLCAHINYPQQPDMSAYLPLRTKHRQHAKRDGSADLQWLEFIVMNRRKVKKRYLCQPGYDIVIGPVADDAVGLVVNNYLAGVYGDPDLAETQATAVRLLESEKLRDQVFFGSEKAAACLHFKEVYPVAANR